MIIFDQNNIKTSKGISRMLKTLKKFLKYFLTFMAPWISMLLIGEHVAAALTFILQITIIGWLPAGLWACSLLKKHLNKHPKPQPKTKGE